MTSSSTKRCQCYSSTRPPLRVDNKQQVMPSAFRRSGTTSKKKVSAPGLSTSARALSPGSSSSVIKKNSAKLPLRLPRGVKPWQGGTYLTSVGVNDLDSILGGGQLIGSSILLEEDRLCTRELALTLVKYWCAEVSP